MAVDQVARGYFDFRRRSGNTDLPRFSGAARVEAAAGSGIYWAGNSSFKTDFSDGNIGFKYGDG